MDYCHKQESNGLECLFLGPVRKPIHNTRRDEPLFQYHSQRRNHYYDFEQHHPDYDDFLDCTVD